jgi:hypothetical protein
LKAFRTVGLGHEFSSKLYHAIECQIQQPFDQHTYDNNLKTIYQKYTSRDLAYRAKAKVVIHYKNRFCQ